MNEKLSTKGPGFRQAIQVEEPAPAPLGSYSHAIRAGNLLYLSGQGCRDPLTGMEAGLKLDEEGKILSYDIEAQTHGCIANLERVLKAAGLGLKDLVDMTIFLADMKDFAAYNKVYAEYFSFAEPPARTTIQAAALPGRNFIEIKAIAIFKD
ncbi:MAG: RidA family protein [Candidatus Obscuribacterales bacterium]|nr:RidA family protein [Candidatus Obscuribacterales bacterium]